MTHQVNAKSPRWSAQELQILDEAYPRLGALGAAGLLAGRSVHSVQQKAFKRRLSAPIVNDAPKPVLADELLEEAIGLREQGWAFMRIARHLDMNEAAVTNAILIALCPRKGFRPAERDATGRLLPEGIERLRYMLKKGLKQVEIQLRLGLSSSRISLERRRYNADLAARGKALLPPPGGGEQYSGVRIPVAKRKAVEALLLEGHGAPTAALKVGVSPAAAKHMRTRLLKRLKRKGETLPGCDQDGRRVTRAKESRHFIPADAVAALRGRLMEGEPVSVAARAVGIGSAAAYRIRDALRVDLAAEGRELPKPIRLGRTAAQRARARQAEWLPNDRLQEFRNLSHEHGFEEAKRLMLARLDAEREAKAAERAAERARPKTFEEQLAMVEAGRVLVDKVVLRRPAPDMTLGGVATGAL